MESSVPHESRVNVIVTPISPVRFGSSNASVQRSSAVGITSTYFPPKE
jgi:hypothetical protein